MPRSRCSVTANRTDPARTAPPARVLSAAVVALVALTVTPAVAGNIRAGLASVDPGLDADATIGDIVLDAGLDSSSGLSLGIEGGDGHLGFGLELTQSTHDINLTASDGNDSVDLSGVTEADIYSALLALRYRINPDSNFVLSLAGLGGAIGYLDFELPDGGSDDGGTTAFGAEAAVDVYINRSWFVRLGYRLLEADIDLDELDGDLAEQLRDSPFEPSIAFLQVGYRFGARR